ncbi:MAG: hypothetical protein R2747_11785 [Pyrinomonadaceae bacterium]
MKNLFKVFLCVLAIMTLQSIVVAQIGYSITDNNRDSTGLAQQYYSFDLATGQGTLIQTFDDGGGTPTIRREYEGLGAAGSMLIGVSEFDTELCNTGSDPVTGLAADIRLFTPTGAGPQIGETCIDFGSEAAAAYNPQDGYIWAIASDDLLPDTAPRSRLYRISPTTGAATLVVSGSDTGITLTASSPPGGEQHPYLDGMAILPNGIAYASENRFGATKAGQRGSLYRIFLTGPNAGRASFVKNTLTFDANRDTGLANLDNGTLYLLLEDGRVFIGNANDSNPFTPAPYGTLTSPGCLRTTPFCGDFEGLDIPNNGAGIR